MDGVKARRRVAFLQGAEVVSDLLQQPLPVVETKGRHVGGERQLVDPKVPGGRVAEQRPWVGRASQEAGALAGVFVASRRDALRQHNAGRQLAGALAERIFAIIGRVPEIITDEKRLRPEKSEVMRLIASGAKARRLLDWSPSVSLDEGLARTIDWIRANPGFFKVGDYHV